MTLREKITKALWWNDETWADVIAHTLDQTDLNANVEWSGFGDFTLWTANHVYSHEYDSDSGDYIVSVRRNPPE